MSKYTNAVPTPSPSKRPTLWKITKKKKVAVNNRGKTKFAADQLVLQAAYSKELPVGDKKKVDILDLLRKNHLSKFYATFL
jgi:hypothetical protein